MTIIALTILNVYDNLIVKFRGYFLYQLRFFYATTGYDIIISFYLFFYLPTNPILAHQISVEQGINLAWPCLHRKKKIYVWSLTNTVPIIFFKLPLPSPIQHQPTGYSLCLPVGWHLCL